MIIMQTIIKLLLIPSVIGIFCGISAYIFTEIIEFTRNLSSYILSYQEKNFFTVPLIVSLGGLISGILSYIISPEAFGAGTDTVIREYHKEGKVPLRTAVAGFLSAGIVIGAGGIAGKGGPLALIGAGFGSSLANFLKLSRNDIRLYTAVGLGAGISAIFKAPLGGAVAGMEIFFRRDINAEALIPGLVASWVSYTVSIIFLGSEPLLPLTFHEESVNAELILSMVLLGIFGAMVSRVFIITFLRIREAFLRIRIPLFLKPAIGCFIAGFLLFHSPLNINLGVELINTLHNINEPAVPFLALVGLILGVSFTVGSGAPGGLFGPSMLAGAFSGLLYYSLFESNLNKTLFIVAGMASVFAGTVKAPLTAVILISEMTGSFDFIHFMLISVVLSYLLSGRESIFPSQRETRLH